MSVAELAGTERRFVEIVEGESWPPPVIVVPEIHGDAEIRRRAAGFIGKAVLESTVHAGETEEYAAPYTLMDAIRRAAEGDHQAYDMILNDVSTDMVERALKSGHINKVKLEVGDQGEILQHGQSAADIQRNSLRYAGDLPQMRRRGEAETRNMFRIEEAYRRRLLEDFAFVVFSPAADDMTDKQMAEVGFFTDTMSCSIQVTSLEEGELRLESAFVAGKSSWNAQRHDRQTLAKIGEALGVDFSGKTATDILDTPLLIHKSRLPGGVIDLVRLYDDCAGGLFFGEAKPRQDYAVYRQFCQSREALLEPRAESAARQLISESSSLDDPRAASLRLGKLSENQMVEASIYDKSIDPRVFGQAAAWRIEQARFLAASGQVDKLLLAIDQARSVARSSSCPGGVGNDALGAANASGEASDQSGQIEEDCEFVSKECPKCHKKDVKTIVKKGVYYGSCGCHS